MNKQQKEVLVTELKQMMNDAEATFLVNYKGLNVAKLQTLRRDVRSEGGFVRVTKASLMRIAARDIPGSEDFSSGFKDQVGLVFAKSDVAAVAKQLVEFSKKHSALQVLAGFYEARLLKAHELVILATLPSKQVLLGQLAGTLQAPISGLARVLHAHLASLAYVLKAVEEKQRQNA